MLSVKVVVLTILIFISTFKTGVSLIFEDSEEEVGKKCETKNNEPGFCTELVKCNLTDQLLRSKRSSNITLCNMIGRIPFVCCPSLPKRPSSIQIVTKISSKFENALCKNVNSFEIIDDHIIGGEQAKVGEFPFQVALGYLDKNSKNIKFDCGGSLIADDIVLTAAHCVNKKEAVPVIVRMGRTSLNLSDEYDESTVQDIKIETIQIHPKHSPKYKHNDIAIIKLAKPCTFSNSVGTICLSTSDDDVPKDLTITGFGLTSMEFSKRSDWLQKGKVREYSHDKCRHKFKEVNNEIIESQLCAFSDKGVDACRGDSGGPVSYEKDNIYYLYGITSFGIGCGSELPSVYTKVNKYLDWIEEEMSAFE